MKAITLTQPWATLLVSGRKKFETRSWRTHYTGPLAIHAASGFPGYAKAAAEGFGFPLDDVVLPRGAIVGIVDLVDCVRTESLARFDWREMSMGDFSDGRWAWRCVPRDWFAKPIPAKGALGLWNWEPPR